VCLPAIPIRKRLGATGADAQTLALPATPAQINISMVVSLQLIRSP
jgi:hypothetical protein